MLPAGLYFSLQDRWQLAPGMDEEAAYEAAGRSERARRVLELIFASGGWADVAQLKEAFGTKDPNPALKLLRDKGVLILETSASRGVGDKKELVAALDIPPEEAMAQVTPKRPIPPSAPWPRAASSGWSSGRSTAGWPWSRGSGPRRRCSTPSSRRLSTAWMPWPLRGSLPPPCSTG